MYIVDDEFSLNWRRATKIAKEIAQRGMNPALIFDSRANEFQNPEFVEAIAPYAFRLLIGAECGYDDGLRRIGKGTTCALLNETAKILDRAGLAERTDFSFIIGLPWETRKEVEQTIRFALRLHGRYGVRVLLQWYCQIPGSRLWDEANARSIVSEAMYDSYGFFRDLYLFRSGVQLTPDEIYEVTELIEPVVRLSRAVYNKSGMVEYAFPESIAVNFPPYLASERRGNGLNNLREVAGGGAYRRSAGARAPMPGVGVGLPLRELG
jgi:radical SAM superfamily enzyme YgiQ (UPF0313 family)